VFLHNTKYFKYEIIKHTPAHLLVVEDDPSDSTNVPTVVALLTSGRAWQRNPLNVPPLRVTINAIKKRTLFYVYIIFICLNSNLNMLLLFFVVFVVFFSILQKAPKLM
jgi:hypothetical protein